MQADGSGPVEVTTRQEGGFTIVAVSGEVDLYSSPRMREAILAGVSRKNPRVIVDLTKVSYMDSSGIATLVEALQLTRKHSGRLVVAGLSERVREVFELARLESVFELSPTVAAAVQSAGSP
jgi:anti-sigma B factor antagonist